MNQQMMSKLAEKATPEMAKQMGGEQAQAAMTQQGLPPQMTN